MADKINILFFLPNFDTGGSEKLVFDIIRHIDKNKFNPVLCVFFTGSYEAEFIKLNIPFYVIHKEGLRSKLSTILFLNNIIRTHSIQVVNTHHSSPLIQGFIPFKVLNRVKWIHTEHTRLDRDPNITPSILKIENFLLQFVDLALGISQGVCDYFHNELRVPQNKIVKIINGVDIEKFEKAKNQEQSAFIRKDLGISDDDIVIGMFANFRKQKNHEMLIKAADILKKEGVSNFKVVLAGTGPELDNIKKLTGDLRLESCVLFLGARHDIPELMNMIDIYCLPSHFEGLPFSVLEAMAAGKPIVATDVEGNNELIKNNKTGLLINDNDSAALSIALKTLIQDTKRGVIYGFNAREKALSLSFNNMMESYERIFSEVLL
jgi:glycosyltransferase involved in cell wall biosynthesis